MSNPAVMLKKVSSPAPPVRMIRFVCTHCDRPLVWAAESVSVKCPSCGRWIQANRFWKGNENKPKGKKKKISPEQLELF